MRHRRHIVLNLNPFSQSLESQNKVTKSIVFAPKLQSVALKHVLCYRNARRRDARVVCAWGGGILSQDQEAAWPKIPLNLRGAGECYFRTIAMPSDASAGHRCTRVKS